jgi:DNA-binding transcriptional ArsR family regulator
MSTAQDLDKIFAALADPTRREIVRMLSHGPVIVSDLAKPFDISLPAISRHLRILQDSGLMTQDKQGRERRCLLNPESLKEVSNWAESCREFWSQRFQALENLLEQLDEHGELKEKK